MIRRRKPLARSTKRIPSISPKRRRAEAILRETVATLEQVCAARLLLPQVSCWGRVAAHHIVPRGRGGRHDRDNLIMLCTAHHDWTHSHSLEAVALGLLR